MSEKWKTILAAGMVILFMIFIFAAAGVYYETNDDRIITEFLSGSMTGEPDARVIYQNYLLSYPLMLLYSITVMVPWYGIFLIGAHCVSLFIIVRSILSVCETEKETGGGNRAVCGTAVIGCLYAATNSVYLYGSSFGGGRL
ncbi:MAG: hypothetical protein LUE16_12890 [Lachnospiraceae bacterium]|nr:hypothetical protein [Lachnospiraceae bacterium]